MDADIDQISKAKEIGADQLKFIPVHLQRRLISIILIQFLKNTVCVRTCQRIGLGVNAGHDLNLKIY